jgi:transaldolase
MNMAGVKINVTAVFTIEQTKKILKYIGKKTPLIISVFSGRIADTGLNPSKDILRHIKISKNYPNVKILWASVREVYNIVQAESVNCDIITIPAAIFEKLNLLNKNLTLFSVETVKTFYEDAKTSKFKIN